MVPRRVRKAIDEFPVVNLFINEQSDKEYYIVKAVLNAREKDHALLKSEILTRMVRIHRELTAADADAKTLSKSSRAAQPLKD